VKIAALSVQAVTVAATPVSYACATGIERREGAIRMSNGCAPSQLRAELSGVGRVMWITNEDYGREKHGDDER
jgi:hypothetical protein